MVVLIRDYDRGRISGLGSERDVILVIKQYPYLMV